MTALSSRTRTEARMRHSSVELSGDGGGGGVKGGGSDLI